MTYKSIGVSLSLTVCFLFLPQMARTQGSADRLFDNGVSSGPQQNFGNSLGTQELFEDFTLETESIITGIGWQQHDHRNGRYNFTRVTIFSTLPYSGPPTFGADIVATAMPNLTPTLFNDWVGFDYEIGLLSIVLPPGTYWIGLNSDFTGVRSGWDNTPGTTDTTPGFRIINVNFPAPGKLENQNLAFGLAGVPTDSTSLINHLRSSVADLAASGTLNNGQAIALSRVLDHALARVGTGPTTAVSGQLGAFMNQVRAMVRSRRLSEEEGAFLLSLATIAAENSE